MPEKPDQLSAPTELLGFEIKPIPRELLEGPPNFSSALCYPRPFPVNVKEYRKFARKNMVKVDLVVVDEID